MRTRYYQLPSHSSIRVICARITHPGTKLHYSSGSHCAHLWHRERPKWCQLIFFKGFSNKHSEASCKQTLGTFQGFFNLPLDTKTDFFSFFCLFTIVQTTGHLWTNCFVTLSNKKAVGVILNKMLLLQFRRVQNSKNQTSTPGLCSCRRVRLKNGPKAPQFAAEASAQKGLDISMLTSSQLIFNRDLCSIFHISVHPYVVLTRLPQILARFPSLIGADGGKKQHQEQFRVPYAARNGASIIQSWQWTALPFKQTTKYLSSQHKPRF